MLSRVFAEAVKAELAAAYAEKQKIEAHIAHLVAFMNATSSVNGDTPRLVRRRGRQQPSVDLRSLKKVPFRQAVRALLQEYKGGLKTREIVEELKKRGVKVKGKTRMNTRVALEMSQARKDKLVHTSDDDKTHTWIAKELEPIRSEGTKSLT